MEMVTARILFLYLCVKWGLCFSLGNKKGISNRIIEMQTRDELKGLLIREINAQKSSPGKNPVWKRVQYPSAESLVKRYASQLEQAQVSGEDGLMKVDFRKGAWDEVIGDWKLLYTNNVGSRPEVSITLPPPPFAEEKNDITVFQLDSVLQRICRSNFGVGYDKYTHLQIDHILRFALALPKLPSSQGDALIRARALEGEVVLEHDVKVISDNSPAKLAIDLRDIKVRVKDDKGVMRDDCTDPLADAFKSLLHSIAGLAGTNNTWADGGSSAYLTMLSVPLAQLLGPSYLRRGYFEVTYVDDDMRISRGPLGELRIFRRVDRESPGQVQEAVEAELDVAMG